MTICITLSAHFTRSSPAKLDSAAQTWLLLNKLDKRRQFRTFIKNTSKRINVLLMKKNLLEEKLRTRQTDICCVNCTHVKCRYIKMDVLLLFYYCITVLYKNGPAVYRPNMRGQWDIFCSFDTLQFNASGPSRLRVHIYREYIVPPRSV